MTDSPNDINLRVIITSSFLEPRFIIYVLDDIEAALYHSDRQDIFAFFELLKNRRILPQAEGPFLDILRDACLERIRAYRHRRIDFERFRGGSFIMEGAIVAVVVWILKETLGKSFGKACGGLHRTNAGPI
jgi:hypothetical protein